MIKPYDNLQELIEDIPVSSVIGDNFIKAYHFINNGGYENIVCSISGGSDSDIMLDIIYRCDKDRKVTYVWQDTGLEYQATKQHLEYLEGKYNIKIHVQKAIQPIPTSCKKLGQPFLSKYASEMIQRLQAHDFKWEDKPFEELYEEYPNCKVALMWWCNCNPKKKNGSESSFNIGYYRYLKEFMVSNPPKFLISNKCCDYAKKKVVAQFVKEFGYDLRVIGIRKAEGGSRSTQYKSCFSENAGCDDYRPLFWYKKQDKRLYENHFGITHSKCYTEYGLTRTGCAGCPFGRNFEQELEVITQYEPKLYKAVNNIFGDSYRYTREYRKFREKLKNNTK